MCFPFCHKWKTTSIVELYQEEEDKLPSSRLYILQCKKCGDLKSKRMR